MGHDVVIRGGNVVDGTGREPFHADIAIDDDQITAIGKVSGKGTEEINADGLQVSPGFIDLHTHMDAQISWDPLVTSISWHGVTTALLGNCGVTFAPCKSSDREYLAAMMETVEDIPREAIMSGLPWTWEFYGDYLNAVENLGPSINVAGLVGHCATRYYVMGERSVEELATEDEIRQIANLAERSVKEGAFGFSTNRLPEHVLPDGRSIPGTFAAPKELEAVAKAIGPHGGLMQTVFGPKGFEVDMEIIANGARHARAALFSTAVEIGNDRTNKKVMKMLGEGSDVISITTVRGGGSVSSLINNVMPNTQEPNTSPAWMELKKLNFADRLLRIRDSAFRAKLIEEVKVLDKEPDGYHFSGKNSFKHVFYMGNGDRPIYTETQSLRDIANNSGEHPVEVWLRIIDETDGKALFHNRAFNRDLEALEELITYDWVSPGLGDGGAHVGIMIDSGWSTFVLSHWHRDRGTYSLQEAIRKITAMPARALNLKDRGTLTIGKRADINVFDLARLEERMPEIVHDFPFGAPRFIQRAAGYKATLVNGKIVLKDDELTGIRAGNVLRSYD
ncbi:MAG: amidohydrolase family protein [Candidatus Azotimanducaceae bacterium]|uniref:Amidohydrolase n=1 Tax=OM182 bacterium TaxID=2510334 RepID=A0A520S251_9GAMM|nr:amidohydrolase [Gammaproteobacteria bacterium]OUV67761.1 MAG: hypothetical protein CBC93_04330 [Gammaproteobacteria bacterium TMED133]RZO76557.1 MAG: amidohydrolase [OM182 bacterium]